MRRFLIITLIISGSFLFVGCTNNESKTTPNASNRTITIDDNSRTNDIPLLLTDNTIYPSPFIPFTNSLVFPNWDDNNKISIIKEPLPKSMINTSDVIEFFNYSTNTLSMKGDIVYFADASNNNSLSSLNIIDKTYKKLNTHNVHDMILYDNQILYINGNDNNLYSYSLTEDTSKVIIKDTVGKYVLNNNFILYENKSDSSKLYSIRIDGSQKEKISNFSVNSFAPYNDSIIAINSEDNNNLYTIDLSSFKATRIALINGEDLKIFNNKIYFINLNDSNYLYSLNIDETTEKVSLSPVVKDGINEYYPNEKGIFFRSTINVNNTYIFNDN